MISKEKDIEEYFQCNLLKRGIALDLCKYLISEDSFILTKVGLPNNILNYDFTNSIELKKTDELIIGTLEGKSIIINLTNRNVYLSDNSFYLAKNVRCFLYQLYTYDYMWNVMIAKSQLGKYRENSNFLKYAKYLEEELLKIDSELLMNDNSYYWGALIEDIEFGIVG